MYTMGVFISSDVNECALGLDDCQHICTNLDGGYSCSCHEGHTRNSKGDCEISKMTQPDYPSLVTL